MRAKPVTPYPELNAVLHEFVSGLRDVLGEELLAVYLQGSFAVGDFDQDSDVDFLVAVRQPLSEDAIGGLQRLHSGIFNDKCAWAQHLEGSYFPLDILKAAQPSRRPLLYLDNAHEQLEWSTHDDTRVVRWVVREYGILLAGPAAATLIEPVSGDDLRSEIRATMRDWAQKILADPQQMNNRWYQPYAVLSYCRMLHTLQTGRVASKLAGARWAEGALEPRWIPLIRRAGLERPDPGLKVRQPADPDDFASTLEFIRYALAKGSIEMNL